MALINSVEVPLILPIQRVLWIASNLVIKCLAELSNAVWSRNLSGAMWVYDVRLSGVKKCWAYTALVQFSHTFSCLSHIWICFRNHSPNISMSKTPSLAKISRFDPLPKNQSSCKKDKHLQWHPKTLQGNRAFEINGSAQKTLHPGLWTFKQPFNPSLIGRDASMSVRVPCYSPLWILRCSFRWCLYLKALPHSVHLNLRLPAPWVSIWCCERRKTAIIYVQGAQRRLSGISFRQAKRSECMLIYLLCLSELQ